MLFYFLSHIVHAKDKVSSDFFLLFLFPDSVIPSTWLKSERHLDHLVVLSLIVLEEGEEEMEEEEEREVEEEGEEKRRKRRRRSSGE